MAGDSQLEQEERCRSEIAQLQYAISHEVLARLRAVDGFSLALEEDCAAQLDEVGRRHLSRVRAAARSIGAQLDALLDLLRVRRAVVHRVRVDVSSLANELLRARAAREPDRVVAWTVAPELVASADAALLRSALEELIDNAWNATASRASAHVEILGSAEGAIGVRDDGLGFDPSRVPRLFQPLQHIHPGEQTGPGIGLALVRCIAERHGGRAWAEGARDRGATIWMSLPSGGRDV